MDAQSTLSIDEYPIVTLSNGHIAALVKHHRLEEAKGFARDYFERLKQKGRYAHSSAIESMQNKLIRFVTLDEWSDNHQKIRSEKFKKRPK